MNGPETEWSRKALEYIEKRLRREEPEDESDGPMQLPEMPEKGQETW